MTFTEIALTVLYLLQHANIPLNLEQISEALEHAANYTYMDAAIAVNSLEERALLKKELSPTGELCSITVQGRLTLSRLINEIRGSVRRAIAAYCEGNAKNFSLESSTSAQIFHDGEQYQVVLEAFDKGTLLGQFILNVTDGDEARLICRNWKKQADEAIAALYTVLIRDMKDC